MYLTSFFATNVVGEAKEQQSNRHHETRYLIDRLNSFNLSTNQSVNIQTNSVRYYFNLKLFILNEHKSLLNIFYFYLFYLFKEACC